MKKLITAGLVSIVLVGCGGKSERRPSQSPAQTSPEVKPLSKQELNSLVSKVMKDNFRAKSGACWLAKNSYNQSYCLKVKSVNSVKGQDGNPETVYILAMGDAVNSEDASHTEGGMAAVFAVQPDSTGGYLTIAKKGPFESGGGWGAGGQGKFVSLGKENYGWKFVSGFCNMGFCEETTVIYGIKNGQVVQLSQKTKTSKMSE